MSTVDSRPLIAHVVYRFDIGGLENGVVNLLNRLPRERWRHAVVALTEATSFRTRVLRDDVRFVELHKGPGHGIALLPRLTRVLRVLAPDVVHTRNLAALEATPAAWLARGLVFQFMELSALAAYQAQYRRFSALRHPASQPDRAPAPHAASAPRL